MFGGISIVLFQSAVAVAALFWINTWSDTPQFGLGPCLVAFLISFIITGLCLRLLGWLRGGGRPSRREHPKGSGLSLPGTNRHPSDGPQKIPRIWIGKNIR